MINSLLALAVVQPIFTTHEFVYMNSTANRVTIAGTFNSWDKSADPLVPDADGRTWRLKKRIAAGAYQYKFVINDTDWIPDPNGENRDDGYGNINTFILIQPADFYKPAVKGDGILTESAITSLPMSGDVVFTPSTGSLRVIARTRRGDAQAVSITTGSNSLPMKRIAGTKLYDIYSATVAASNHAEFSYEVEVKDADNTIRFARSVAMKDITEFEVPKWTRSAVFYQIFPDRFANGSKSNDPKDVVPWDADPTYSNFMGGDLAGISQKTDYLTQLGVTGLYLNPIFQGPSNHGYETTNYKLIEPRLGTNAEFGILTKKLKKAGIATVLDGVFNHTSTDFAAFREIVAKNEKASTLNWYTIKSFPVTRKPNPPYEAWAGYESMPKLNVLDSEVKRYLMSVVDYWHENAEIAGWRLDVANEVPESFWREFRTHIKGLDQNAWIIGENWTDSSQWLKGDQWDSAMNYPFRSAVIDHIANRTTTSTEFADALMASYLMYSPGVSKNMLNAISTHDVPRFKTVAGNSNSRNILGLVALFAWPGVPCLYYGDEIGMEGGKDPENRRGMRWDMANSGNFTLSLTQRLALVRRNSEALQIGEPIILKTDDQKQISVFARVAKSDVAIVAFNNSGSTQTIDLSFEDLEKKLPNELVDVVSGKALSFSGGARLRLQLPGETALLAVSPDCIEPITAQRNQNQLVIQK